jgi:hypothetical protein
MGSFRYLMRSGCSPIAPAEIGQAYDLDRSLFRRGHVPKPAGNISAMGRRHCAIVHTAARRYTAWVRRLSVLALLIAVITVTLGDPLYCADGCGQSDLARSHQGATGPSGECLLCQTAALPTIQADPTPALASADMPEALTAAYVPPPTARLEHPPRL